MTIAQRSRLHALRSLVAGDVFLEGEAGYDSARRPFELMADQRPAAVAFPRSAADIARIVSFARTAGVRVAPQGTGHGAIALEDLAGAILLRTTRMRRVDIDPARRTARVQAGALWQDVTVPAAQYGLAALAGTAPDVGVVGYTLGGGLGWLARRHGLAANSVTAVDVVLPDGRVVHADASTEPDLLWAARGGGGVGVITAMEFALYPVLELYAGALYFPAERAGEALHAWRRWTATVPPEVTSIGRMLRFPDLDAVPPLVRGRTFALVEAAYLGEARAGAELLAPLRRLRPSLDTFAPVAPPELGRLHMDPPQPAPGVGDGMLLAHVSAGTIEAVLAAVGPGSSLQSVELRQLGGALAQRAGDGPQATLDAEFLMFAGALATSAENAVDIRSDLRALKAALGRWHAGQDYFNLLEAPVDADAVLEPQAYRRLSEIKASYDPAESIVSRHPVRPAVANVAIPRRGV
jgi:FAD/FMN-containing dehydrogenase